MWRKTVKMLLTTDPPYLRGLESDGLFKTLLFFFYRRALYKDIGK